jgi:superfamily II DNA or RNA helicase
MVSRLSADDATALRELLKALPKRSRRLAQESLAAGDVSVPVVSSDGQSFDFVVAGSVPCEPMVYRDIDGWAAHCSCTEGTNCKHIGAALLWILTRMSEHMETTPTRPLAVSAQLQLALGRALKPPESAYLRDAIKVHESVSRFGYLSQTELRSLSASLKPEFARKLIMPPRHYSFVDFWSFLAQELRAEVTLPEFMRAIEDPVSAEETLEAMRRDERVQQWSDGLKQSVRFPDETMEPPSGAAYSVDVRLTFHTGACTLQVRMAGQDDFKTLPVAKINALITDFDRGDVDPVPECMPVFSFFYRYWLHAKGYFSRSVEAGTVVAMERLSSDPASRTRMVDEKGSALEWMEGRLHWHLTEATDAKRDHVMELRRPDGTPVTDVVTVFSGRHALYITRRFVFRGPPRVALPGATYGQQTPVPCTQLEIPAEVVASKEGMAYLLRAGLPVPSSLRERIRTIVLSLRVTVEPDEAAGYSSTEYARFSFAACDSDGAVWMTLSAHGGWQKSTRSTSAASGSMMALDSSALPNANTLLEGLNSRWQAYTGTWQVRITRKFPEQFMEWLSRLPPETDLQLSRDFSSFREPAISARVTLDCQPVANMDWFDLCVVVDVKDTILTPDEKKALLTARGGFVRLKGKGWRRLQFEMTEGEQLQLANLGLSVSDFSAEPQRLHALQLADKAAEGLLAENQLVEIRRRAARVKMQVTPPLPVGVRAELRHYQLQGFHFLAYLSENRFGGILADDMGLGKTLQTLCWLVWLREKAGGARASVVVCPKSVVENWQGEAARFTPGLKVTVWRGTDEDGFEKAARTYDLVIINYAQLRYLAKAFGSISWLAAILDEGQYIKNPSAQTTRVARSVKADHRLVLTGTPIENRLLDLWSLMSYTMPGALGSQTYFNKQFQKGQDPLARRRLAARVRPFLLRRTKAQVAPELPPRTEEDRICEMTEGQSILYRAELKHAQQMLLNLKTQKDLDKARFNILTSLLRLRQICCHTALINKSAPVEESAKIEALKDLLEPLMEEGHKVLVFSQFVGMINLLKPVMDEHSWKCFVLTGDTEDRGELVKEFQAEKEAAVFLISLRAGGFGLNLTAASYVVLCDPWWNPAVENQAIDRTHRIGQSRHVIAYRLITKNSIEEKIRLLQKAKNSLAVDLLGEEQFAKALTIDDMKFLLADP